MKKELRALIVDDEAELRKSVLTILRTSIPDFEFEVEEAANGAEAVEKFKTGDWDLVLMDVRMPDLDGPGSAVRPGLAIGAGRRWGSPCRGWR